MKKIISFVLLLAMPLSVISCVTPEVYDDLTTSLGDESTAPEIEVGVHSWISHSYEKNTAHSIVNDKGNIYDFKENYGNEDYAPFSVLKRSHKTGESKSYNPKKLKCAFNHNSTIYGNKGEGLVRVDSIGDGKNLQNYNEYSTPGMFYILPSAGYDILICFTAPEEGEYIVRAAAQRTHLVCSENGISSTGSRFFIEHNGDVIAEDTDPATDSTKPIGFERRLTLKKGDTVSFGHDPIDGDSTTYAATDDDSVIKYFYLERVDGELKSTPKSTHIELEMAKNERESFQISVNSPKAMSGLRIRNASAQTDGIEVEYLEEHHINVNNLLFPDALTESDGCFDVNANETKTMLVRFASSKTAKAGKYNYVFELTDSSGLILEVFTVELTVWSFTLPDESACDTATGVFPGFIIEKEGIGEDKIEEYYKLYYDLLLEYKMNAYRLPYDILDERAEAYMSDPRVSSFELDANVDDATLRAYNERLKSNPVWLEKAYFYPIDEPTTLEHLQNLAKLCTRLRENAPDIKIVAPFFTNINASGEDQIDFMADYIDLWCPKSACFNPGFLRDPYNNGYFGDRMQQMKERGDKVWWYVCWEPCYPYCNLQTNELGIEHRILFWQQYICGSDGLLYWSSNYWRGVDNVWTDGNTVNWINPYVYGDGSLMYPGAEVGVKGACASLRLECIRNGVEDFDMLKLAEQKLGRDYVEEQIEKVTKSLVEHTSDASLFASVRKAIGTALDQAEKG